MTAPAGAPQALGGVYLSAFLEPLAVWLRRPDVTDILVNRPGEVWVESVTGGIVRHEAPDVTQLNLTRLAAQIARISKQGVSREHPLLSASLPTGERIQIVLPPATRGEVALAIRKHVLTDLTLDDYVSTGALAHIVGAGGTQAAPDPHAELKACLASGNVTAFLRLAVRQRRNIVVSGGTGTGKTTFLNALLKEIDLEERLVLIEDAAEIRLLHQNAVGLVAVKGQTGEARVDVDDLLQAALRMRPDRIIVGELRGKEAFTFLRAINTGHPGSVTTLHADTPDGALEQLALMALQTGTAMTHADILAYVRSVVDVIVQLERTQGRRQVREIRLLR
ncbi:type IV secretion system protein VirB11 [Candidatus Phycosocius bacilliformis]|uniref:Type IV secretion system protein VirB11 n=1 Tax=Candidatus Phycosocius bacilliformis TaxID=1445552 RepID=A0A2P2E6Z2_9PROT|nr:P-type DNA transfer ATPase VirB11 [Candidatus Phycosocius bacilliformis]GBF56826.1 type IV secretion system protein VirB11 [Candidatus Phycosocius bacilliformis]